MNPTPEQKAGAIALANRCPVCDAALHIVGRGLYSADGSLVRITSADLVDLTAVMTGGNAAQMAIDRQLTDLREPQDLGDYGTITLDPEYVERVSFILHEMTDDARLPLPYLYATPNRTIQAEWSAGAMEITCEFTTAPMVADVMAVYLDSAAYYEGAIDLGEPGKIDELVRWVRPFILREVSSDE